MNIRLHRGDLPDNFRSSASVAIDTETLGLNPHRDRLCLVQISAGDGDADLVQIAQGQTDAPNLVRLLADPDGDEDLSFRPLRSRHSAKDLRRARRPPSIAPRSPRKLTRTYTDRHGLKDLVRELLAVEISKQQQSSDWGAAKLTEAQLAYAASDVLHLHALRGKLDVMLAREGRMASRRPVSPFCPPAPNWIWRAGRKRIFSPICDVWRPVAARRVRSAAT